MSSNKSLACPQNLAALEAKLFASVTTQTVVTRDNLNRPTITGGTFAEMCWHSGYEYGRDKLWDFYLQVRVFAGQLCSLVGRDPLSVASDTNIAIQDYGDQIYMNQYNNFSNVTQTAMIQFIAGFNARIQDVLDQKLGAPMPAEFEVLALDPVYLSLLDFIRFGYHITSDYSPQKIAMNAILDNFAQIENLVVNEGKTLDEAKLIVGDLFNSKRQRANGIAAASAPTNVIPCGVTVEKKKESKSFLGSLSSKKPSRDSSIKNSESSIKDLIDRLTPKTNIAEQLKEKREKEGYDFSKIRNPFEMDENDEEVTGTGIAGYLKRFTYLTEKRRSWNINCPTEKRLESWSIAIHGDHTKSGETITLFSPQINCSSNPPFESNQNFVNPELGIDHKKCGHLFASMGLGGLGDYKFSTSSVLGSLTGVDPVLQDPTNDLHYRDATIVVRGGAPITIPVYVSSNPKVPGFVIQQGITSTLFNGPRSLVACNPDFENELSFFDIYFLMFFSDSIEQLQDTVRGELWSTGMDIVVHGSDNQGNIFIGERAGWYDFDTSDIIPQGICGEPIIDATALTKQSGYFVTNPAKGYCNVWNSAVIGDKPCVYGDGSISRVQWLDENIEAIISVRPIESSDLRSIFMNIGNAAQGPNIPDNRQEYWSDQYHCVFKDRFAAAIATDPSDDRNAAVALLSNYTGGMVNSTNPNDIVVSRNLQDGFMLAGRWVWFAQSDLIKATFGNAYSNYTTSSDQTQAIGTYYSNTVLSLLARVLGISNLNALNYQNWALNAGDLDALIVNALDKALASLGTMRFRPWGTNKRPVAVYEHIFFGALPFSTNSPPVANRGGVYFTAEFQVDGSVVCKCICQIGQSSLILFQYAFPVMQDSKQQTPYVAWTLANI